MNVWWTVTILVYTCCKRRLVEISLILTDHLGNQNVPPGKTIKMGRVSKMKIVVTLKPYLVPNVDNPIVRIPMWQETQTFETHIIGDLTIEKTITVCVAYEEDNGNIVPEVKFIE